MPYGHIQSGNSLHLIGGIGGMEHLGQEEYDRCLRLCICFLQGVLGDPPAGSELAIQTISDNHCYDRIIVLQFDTEPDGAERYAQHAEAAYQLFVGAVDWQAIEAVRVHEYLAQQRFLTTEELLTWVASGDDDSQDTHKEAVR